MKEDSCVHFNGLSRRVCAQGISYRELAGEPEYGYVRRLPCFTFKPEDKPEHVFCQHFRAPTKEELEASEAEIQRVIKMLTKVNPLVAKFKKENRGRSTRAIFECPVCGGTLHMSIASTNGHVHGQCETKGCVSWME